MIIIFKVCKPDNFELHNSLKFTFIIIPGLNSSFLGSKSQFESTSPDILPFVS